MSDPLSSRSLYLLPNHDDIVQRTRQRLPTASTVPFHAGNPPACATLELRTSFELSDHRMGGSIVPSPHN